MACLPCLGVLKGGRMKRAHGVGLVIACCLNGLFGIVLLLGGIWLITLGGSWFYAAAGLALLGTAILLIRRKLQALWLYAVLVILTLLWALWESGLDWWPLAIRGNVIFLLGLFMVTPWVTRPLLPQARARTTLPLMSALFIFLLVAVASWFVDPHARDGVLASRPVQADAQTSDITRGEWHAYGRTNHGQRYSPLTQITPDNVTRLEEVWHYRTGDIRGRPGDPEETTFQVTPLKIGELLYLCTPHQSVIALNATTGEEVWRYDPQIRDQLALQHLTCRGLSYHDGSGAESAAASLSQQAADTATDETLTRLNLPVVAEDGKTTEDCTAKLFMPTADGRVIALNPEDGAVCRAFG